MRRIALFLFALVLTFSLLGCNGDSDNATTSDTTTTAPVTQPETEPTTEPTTTTAPVTQPTTEPTTTTVPVTQPETKPITDTAPSETMIRKDLKNALAEKNGDAVIQKQEIVKSLTNDNSYFVTMSVAANTQYADWQYEVDMNYTKYDQGWMLDDVQWTTKSSLLTRIPSENQMAALANDVFAAHKSEELNKLATIKAGRIRSEDTLETGVLSFTWSRDIVYKHGVTTAEYTAEWNYDIKEDRWSLAKAKKNADTYVEGLQIVETLQKVRINRDFSGTWSLLNGNPITISNFSPSGFEATWEGNTGKFQRLLSVSSYYFNDAPNCQWYTDGSNYLCLQFGEEDTKLTICHIGVTVNFTAFATITDELPYL